MFLKFVWIPNAKHSNIPWIDKANNIINPLSFFFFNLCSSMDSAVVVLDEVFIFNLTSFSFEFNKDKFLIFSSLPIFSFSSISSSFRLSSRLFSNFSFGFSFCKRVSSAFGTIYPKRTFWIKRIREYPKDAKKKGNGNFEYFDNFSTPSAKRWNSPIPKKRPPENVFA